MTEEAAASCFLRNAGYAKVSLQGEGKDFVILSAGQARSDHEEGRWFRRSVRRRIRDSSLRSGMTRGASRGSRKNETVARLRKALLAGRERLPLRGQAAFCGVGFCACDSPGCRMNWWCWRPALAP